MGGYKKSVVCFLRTKMCAFFRVPTSEKSYMRKLQRNFQNLDRNQVMADKWDDEEKLFVDEHMLNPIKAKQLKSYIKSQKLA